MLLVRPESHMADAARVFSCTYAEEWSQYDGGSTHGLWSTVLNHIKQPLHNKTGLAPQFLTILLLCGCRRQIHGEKEDDVAVPPLFKTALVWGLFMGVSSNLRYQVSHWGRQRDTAGAYWQLLMMMQISKSADGGYRTNCTLVVCCWCASS